MTRLDIISDPVCPWCYIGKARLDRALEQRPDHPFETRWRPFQLNPDMPAGGMDRATYLSAKFGGDEAAARVYAHIAEVARETGLDLRLDEIPRAPNTLDAHRLIRWAGIEGRQTLVANQLFRRYFVALEDISDHAVLCDIARTAGMDEALVARLLAGDADTADVREEDAAAREMGVTGVPTFILGGRYALQGAQESETWLRVIDDITSAMKERSA